RHLLGRRRGLDGRGREPDADRAPRDLRGRRDAGLGGADRRLSAAGLLRHGAGRRPRGAGAAGARAAGRPALDEDVTEETAMGARAGRFGLIFPFLLVGLAAAVWTGWWFVLADRVRAGVEDAAKDLRAAGYAVTFERPQMDGYPFRTRVV